MTVPEEDIDTLTGRTLREKGRLAGKATGPSFSLRSVTGSRIDGGSVLNWGYGRWVGVSEALIGGLR